MNLSGIYPTEPWAWAGPPAPRAPAVCDPPAPGAKHDHGKARLSLVPPEALWAMAEVLEYGARKYSPDGWRQVPDARRRYFDAAQRHLWAWWQGQARDPESGQPHLAHALCCVAVLIALPADQEAP